MSVPLTLRPVEAREALRSSHPVEESTVRRIAALILLAAPVSLLTACAGGTVDIAPAVDELNATLAEAGVSASCPTDEVESGVSFTCTLTGEDTGASADVEMAVTEIDGELQLDVVDQAAFEQAVLEVSGVEG